MSKSRLKCENCAKVTSAIGLVAGLALAALKLSFGYLGRSRALIASGMCNLSDVSSAFVVILGVKYSQKGANRRYPYGFGKVEFIAQVGISALMILGNVVLLMSSFIVIAQRTIVIPHLFVIFVALISALVNGLMYKFARCGHTELNSPALKAHAEHNKIDIASSILVMIGVLASHAGLHWADPVIAIFECLHVIWGSWVIFWDGFKGIMDTSAPREYIEAMRERVEQLPKVRRVPKIYARQSGPRMLLDMTLELDPSLTVLESKKIVTDVREELRRYDRHMGNVFIQIKTAERPAAAVGA
ncbi:MAG: cation transporter [Candidatus Omnitrophica bacterium]|nr:cation transporter [Candidatus Omnitrophota bacterium]